MADIAARGPVTMTADSRSSLHKLMQRKSTVALPDGAAPYPPDPGARRLSAGYAVYLAMLNKGMTKFVASETSPSCSGATLLDGRLPVVPVRDHAVIFKAIIGFVVAHFVHNIPTKGQRKWRGMLLVPWVIRRHEHACLAVAVRSVLLGVQLHLGACRHRPHRWLGETGWARFSVILVNVWIGSPFFIDHVPGGAEIGARAALRAASIDGATLVAAHLVRDLADDAQHHRHHGAVLADRHLRQLRTSCAC